eukprot:TRINITY_DN9538_c0_g1_i1.p1 TRINITY_DN9538_c0_g1~~TRINITY_DN9538_c0_g1_i1.p1  ORF type:complete len:166 (+),score=21.20 TRINITY_DN9538_c0_g1_i1:65-562(+)
MEPVPVASGGGWVIAVTHVNAAENNFVDFYRDEEDLDSDFLMAPVNEADYDSETQCLVDSQNPDGPKSFYDHFVTKRKKKGLRKEAPTVPKRAPLQPDLLLPQRIVPLTDPRQGFATAAARRLACGRMPPREASSLRSSESSVAPEQPKSTQSQTSLDCIPVQPC